MTKAIAGETYIEKGVEHTTHAVYVVATGVTQIWVCEAQIGGALSIPERRPRHDFEEKHVRATLTQSFTPLPEGMT